MTTVRAQDQPDSHPYLVDRFYVGIGLFFPEREIKLSVDGTVPGSGPGFDFSEQLHTTGAEEETNYEFGWRYSDNWMLRAQHFSVDGKSIAVLNEDILWHDVVFNAGTNVAAGSEMSVTRLFMGRKYRTGDRSEVGLGGGLHLLEISAFIRGRAFINGEDAGVRLESASTQGPLPNIGAWYVRSFSERAAMTVRLDWLSASVGKYNGRIVNAAAGLNYAFTEHLGLGLSYNYFELSVGIKDESWRGRAKHRFNGAHIFFSAYW